MEIRTTSVAGGSRAPIRDAETLGSVIAELRRTSGLDQEELARRVGVHRPALSHLETGRAVTQVELIFRVLRELGYEVRLEPTGTP